MSYTVFMSVERSIKALLIISVASIFLFVVRAVSFESLDYWYLIWNLLLAWVPLGFALLVVSMLGKNRWLSPALVLLTAGYVGFLPNSFYIATDFIHVQYASNQTILVDVVMILMFTIAGFASGLISLVLIHQQLLKRLRAQQAHMIITGLLLACSFAIYLGRFLRWNTWDVLTNPGGIIFDVSYRLANPIDGRQMVSTTLLFFILLGSIYAASWQITAKSSLRIAKKHV